MVYVVCTFPKTLFWGVKKRVLLFANKTTNILLFSFYFVLIYEFCFVLAAFIP
ncbi:CDP-diacylglycerol-glycerol-3-phosphate 3-phosphatidyltransferase [Prevotella pallens ATCC 700821]|uniref:CDP-diacylglycerol-glycerol-3-phosphate 3-phosphatidyltransferase n=1 Tax=Prevotella pallens ATCC 700821 TaxID=997353 RepID=F9DKN7_9BACT|nr:CDP-diacylglycerol-glycerol-3-phosphate 3-phosphatidyltransferase [Prevotella pallens ATCC 700821]